MRTTFITAALIAIAASLYVGHTQAATPNEAAAAYGSYQSQYGTNRSVTGQRVTITPTGGQDGSYNYYNSTTGKQGVIVDYSTPGYNTYQILEY